MDLRESPTGYGSRKATDSAQASEWHPAETSSAVMIAIIVMANRCRVDVVAPLIDKLVGMVPKLRGGKSED
jgi:hypothetical protein